MRAVLSHLVQEVLGDPSHTSAAKLRRLHFESFTLTVADLRIQSRKLPIAELANRIGNLQRDIDPLKIEGPLSHPMLSSTQWPRLLKIRG